MYILCAYIFNNYCFLLTSVLIIVSSFDAVNIIVLDMQYILLIERECIYYLYNSLN